MPDVQSRLFHSIVAVGLSFTAACGGTTTTGSGGGRDATVPSDGESRDARADHAKDGASADDRIMASDGGSATDSAASEASPTCSCHFEAGCAPRDCSIDSG